ncbi:formimidoylglutamate deiminase [Sphingomonas sp. PB4P5]|uniref:formimidoylglutamate deiminase n=1 Tax=Parasphingomonas puruogangriensis TaxID=3096155 RepID=UPI002FC6CA26
MTNLFFDSTLTPAGWQADVRVAIDRAGLITSVTVDAAPGDEDERHALGLPGLPNLHSHAFQRAMAGLTERRGATRDSFWTWRELMYRFAARLDPDLLEAIAAMAFVEMLESGSTRTGEFHYVHHQADGAPYADVAAMAGAIARAAAATGIGLTLLPVFYGASGFGGQQPSALQRRFVTNIDQFEALVSASEVAVAPLPDAIVGIAPHSLRAVPPDLLPLLATMRPAAPIHIHIAEQVAEVEASLAWSGRRPVDWLYDTQTIDQRWCLVHATHVTAGELDRIAASGAVVGLCPITEANLGDGIFPAAAFAQRGGRFGVGSDSNVLIDAAEELRSLEYSQRLAERQRNVLAEADRHSTGRTLFDTALAGGAQALGQRVGGLVAGASADIVTLDMRHPALAGRHGDALLDSWIFAGGAKTIDTVWRRGARVVQAGRHVAREQVIDRYLRSVRLLLDGA